MIDIVIAAFLWTLIFALLVFRRSKVQSITYAVVAIAISSTLNIGPLYVWTDSLLGGRNVVDLIANWSLMVGAFFLARGVAQAYEFTSGFVRILLGPASLCVAAALMTVCFIFIDAPDTSTRFMADYGNQPAAAAYSIIQYIYLGGVMLAMARVSLAEAPRSTGFLRVSAWTLAIGSGIGVLLAVDVIGMDIANVAGMRELLSILQSCYDVLHFRVC